MIKNERYDVETEIAFAVVEIVKGLNIYLCGNATLYEINKLQQQVADGMPCLTDDAFILRLLCMNNGESLEIVMQTLQIRVKKISKAFILNIRRYNRWKKN